MIVVFDSFWYLFFWLHGEISDYILAEHNIMHENKKTTEELLHYGSGCLSLDLSNTVRGNLQPHN